MTAPLAGALVLSLLTGVTVSWFFIAWPRRISAEEWIVHRRSFQRAHETTKQFGGLSILRTGSGAGVRGLSGGGPPLVNVWGPEAPAPPKVALCPPGLFSLGSAARESLVPRLS